MDLRLNDDNRTRQFEAAALPHLDAAYNLARWLTRNDQDAQDLVQMAFVRAFRFFDGFHGGDARAWLLTIVRNTYFSALRDRRREDGDVGFDEALHSDTSLPNNPATLFETRDAGRVVHQALDRLPRVFREIVMLKEIEDLSYKEIAEVVGIPIGTVMSRLARGRKLLADYLHEYASGEVHGL
ncbi:MAG: sigma-70 family RNA polymerase sigma factor [Pseudomonadota bacterium]